MAETTLGKEIKNGMDVIRGDFKLAGIIRNAQLVARQGYVSFKKPEAVAAFHANPDYIDWTCKFSDGEYKFFPPESKRIELLDILERFNNGEIKNAGDIYKKTESEASKSKEEILVTREIVDTYKDAIADSTKVTMASFTVVQGNPVQVKYRLITSEKSTGKQKIVQEFITEFEGKFSMEILPSLYNQMMGGLPVIDSEKGEDNQKSIFFQSVEGSRRMGLSNLTDAQLDFIKNMKKYVDSQYFSLEETHKGIRR